MSLSCAILYNTLYTRRFKFTYMLARYVRMLHAQVRVTSIVLDYMIILYYIILYSLPSRKDDTMVLYAAYYYNNYNTPCALIVPRKRY